MPARNIDRQTRKLLRAGGLIALLLLAWAIFSPWGAIRYYQLANELAQLEAANVELRKNNSNLRAEIDRLTNDPAHIENIARKQYGLLRNNELVYIFPNRPDKH